MMCQINMIKEMGSDDKSLKIKKNFGILLRVIGIVLFIKEIRKFKKKKYFNKLPSPITSDLKPGDLVRVRSKKQILQTLDANNKFDGCFFMAEMWRYCGSKQKVLKKIDYFYDEREGKMYKASNIVLLEGINCSGKLENLMPKCDRNCYLFWKEVWLEKIDS